MKKTTRHQNDPKRIAFIHVGMGRGGAERVISFLANEYAAAGWHVDIIVYLDSTIAYPLAESIRLLPFLGKQKGKSANTPYWIRSTRRYVKHECPDVIVSFSLNVNLIVLLACLGLRQRVIVSERTDPSADRRSWIRKQLSYILYQKAEKVVFQTHRAMSCFPNRVQRRGCVISNPIEVQCNSETETAYKIVSAGRLDEGKNHHLLLLAFSMIAKLFPVYSLHIFGEGYLRTKLEQYIIDLGLQGRVFLEGESDCLHQKIADAALFVLSSDFEGLSNALMEAMMMGLPCISTRCAGSDEIINDGVNGLLTPIGDEVALSDAIKRMLSDPAFAQQCGWQAAQDARAFRKETVIPMWRTVIEE